MVLFVVGVAVASAGIPLESQADCAKQMCQDMRLCNAEFDGVRKPTGSASWNANQTPAKKSDQAQGVTTTSCYAEAYLYYTNCYGNVVKKPTGTTGTKTVKTVAPAPSNK